MGHRLERERLLGWKKDWVVECKPSLGDDYPAVLRNWKYTRYNRNDFMLLGHGGYNGAGATFDQVKKIFAKSGIKIVSVGEVDLTLIETTAP